MKKKLNFQNRSLLKLLKRLEIASQVFFKVADYESSIVFAQLICLNNLFKIYEKKYVENVLH